MNPLSLESINANAAYFVVAGESQSGTFLFSSTSGNDYAISFNEDLEIVGSISYQFVIRRLNEHIGGHDPKIQVTIMAIINEFFRQNKDILLILAIQKIERRLREIGCLSDGFNKPIQLPTLYSRRQIQ